ncbi:MAG TPA: hypothetical protein VGQ76_08905 [Thermoanaerobaculia bacterium]|nr:hypothetical protein [Thermoanaerobaculia bacterium]
MRAEWEARDAFTMQIVDERERADPRDFLSFAELFLHDAFLLFNIAVPGSFGGVMTCSIGEEWIERMLDARVFENAWVASARGEGPVIEPLALENVVAWYDAQNIGTQQLATFGVARALFHLLHLSRAKEDDTPSILRLTLALDALEVDANLQTLRELRTAIANGTAPVVHPMYDDSLDPRVDDPSLDVTLSSTSRPAQSLRRCRPACAHNVRDE